MLTLIDIPPTQYTFVLDRTSKLLFASHFVDHFSYFLTHILTYCNFKKIKEEMPSKAKDGENVISKLSIGKLLLETFEF